MLTIGGKDLLKRWHYPNNVTDVYLGVHHIWPSFNPYYFFGIMVPGGSTANEGIPDSAYNTSGNITINVDAAGTSGTISVRSRYYTRDNKFELVPFDNDGPSEATADWWYVSPGAGETFGYTINENTTSSVRTAVLKITQATTGNVITVNIVQAAGAAPTKNVYLCSPGRSFVNEGFGSPSPHDLSAEGAVVKIYIGFSNSL